MKFGAVLAIKKSRKKGFYAFRCRSFHCIIEHARRRLLLRARCSNKPFPRFS
jgi:hypothetical protein